MSNKNKTTIKLFLHRMILVLGLAAVIPAYSTNLPDSQELIRLLGVDQKKLANLEQGKTVSSDVAEGKENELEAGVVMYLPASPTKIVRLINKKGLASIDSDLLAQDTLSAQATLDAFKGFGLRAGSDEAKDFLQESMP